VQCPAATGLCIISDTLGITADECNPHRLLRRAARGADNPLMDLDPLQYDPRYLADYCVPVSEVPGR